MPYTSVNGLRLFYEEYGQPSARPILLIPGLGESHKSWLDVSWQLKERSHVIAVDPRDAGLSQRASHAYTMADMAGDVAGLLSALGIAEADVVGFSMGGAIAQELALNHPRSVRRLVLVASYDRGDSRGTALFQNFSHLRRVLSKQEYYRNLLPWIYTHREFEGDISFEDSVHRLSTDAAWQEPEAYERQVQAAVQFASRDRLGDVARPTLLIFGEDDIITPMRFARSMEERIRGSRLAVLAGTGHGLLWTRSTEVASLIDGFLSAP